MKIVEAYCGEQNAKDIEFFNHNKKNLVVITGRKITQKMYNAYSKIIQNDLLFVSDDPPELNKVNIYHISDKIAKDAGFIYSGLHDVPLALDKALYYLKYINKIDYDYIWFIEDDVYINETKFMNWFNQIKTYNEDYLIFNTEYLSKEQDPNWAWWKLNNKKFEQKDLMHCVNTLFRISKKLLNSVFDFQTKYDKFVFIELFLPSLVKKHKLSYKVINNDNIRNIAGGGPIKLSKNLINHGVYDFNTHKDLIISHPSKLWFDYI